MISNLFPFYASVCAMIIAQLLKPIIYYFISGRFDRTLFTASGSFPSSHVAAVTALSLAVGFKEAFSSTLFAVTIAFSMIIAYDAMNVRYYSGKNIEITQQLLTDLEKNPDINLDNPIYNTEMKKVLGHKRIEVFGGACLGALTTLLMYLLIVR